MSSIVQAGLFAGLTVLALAATPPFPDASSGQFHRLKLKPLIVPPSGQVGLLIMARVNGGPPLRLLLDSGAQFLVLDKKAAAKSRCCQGGSALDLIGAGATPKTAKAVTADAIEVGEILLRHVDVVIVEMRLLDEIDGVLPLALFADYVIRLDLRDKNLELKPYCNEPAIVSDAASRAVADNRLLFVKGVLNDSYEGLFLLDTGATYNAISTNLARRMNSTAALTRPVSMQGGTAQMDAHFVSGSSGSE